MRLALHGIDAGGSTDLGGGWLAGCRELAGAGASSARSRRALLLTDGQANVGITDTAELVGHAAELRTRGISTTTIGFGHGFDEELLQAMAEAGGGNFQFVERAEDLRAFFEAELREMLRVAALGLTLEVGLPDGLHAFPVSAFPASRNGRTWTIALGDLPAGEEIEVVFRLEVRGGRVGDELPVGIAAVWTDPLADRRQTARVAPRPSWCRPGGGRTGHRRPPGLRSAGGPDGGGGAEAGAGPGPSGAGGRIAPGDGIGAGRARRGAAERSGAVHGPGHRSDGPTGRPLRRGDAQARGVGGRTPPQEPACGAAGGR
jgi:hypothetical protein